MIKTSPKKTLIVLFFIFSFVKIFFSIFLNGPTTFPDEACFALKAMDFVDHFSFRSCEEVSGFDSGGEFPLYIFFISPIYFFLRGKASFFALMIFQSLISASLIFPLFKILKKFFAKNSTAILLSSVLLFVPQIFAYEKTMMSEFLFIVLAIWFLNFYIYSFGKKYLKNKILAYLFSILCALTRPFGFIFPMAVFVNELIVYKKKKFILILILTILASVGLLFVFTGEGLLKLGEKFSSLLVLSNYKFILISIINQINSFSIVAFLMPVFVFFVFMKKKDLKPWNNIKWFFAVFIFLNFLMSAQHIYGYYLEGRELNLLSRYVFLSSFFLIFSSFVFLTKYKKIKIKFLDIVLFFILILSFFFLSEEGKRVQNVDISAFYRVFADENRRTVFMYILKYPLLISYLSLFYLFLKNKFIWVRNILIALLIVVSIFSIRTISQVPWDTSLTNYIIEHPGISIDYIVTGEKKDLMHFWKFMAYDNYEINSVRNLSETELLVDVANLKGDVIISFFDLPGLEILGSSIKNGTEYKLYKAK